MSQRIHLNPNRGQPAYAPPAYSAGYSPDPISTSRPATSDNEFVAKIQQVSGQVEDMIEIYTQVRGEPRRRAARSEGRAAVARTHCARWITILVSATAPPTTMTLAPSAFALAPARWLTSFAMR